MSKRKQIIRKKGINFLPFCFFSDLLLNYDHYAIHAQRKNIDLPVYTKLD